MHSFTLHLRSLLQNSRRQLPCAYHLVSVLTSSEGHRKRDFPPGSQLLAPLIVYVCIYIPERGTSSWSRGSSQIPGHDGHLESAVEVCSESLRMDCCILVFTGEDYWLWV